MPEKIWDLTRLRDVALSGEEIATTRAGLQLRRRDPETGRYSPDGLYVPGEATLPDHRALGLTELYGLRADLDENNGRVLLRLSPDGGATWLFHNGASWALAAGPADWNTVDQVDREIPSFPLAGRRVRPRVRIEPPTDGSATPVLRCLALFLEHEVVFGEDLVRSVKHHIERGIAARGLWRGDAAGLDKVTLDTDFEVQLPVRAYDLAADPARATDLFTGLAGKVVTLSKPATGAVEVQFAGRAPVHIATDVDFQVSEIPSIVLQLPTVTEVRRLRSGDRKLDWALARRRVRERLQPVWLAADLLVSCQSARKRDTLAMADALARLFEYERTVVSEATGEEFTVSAYGPANAQDAVGRGLYVVQVALTLTGPAWLGEAQEKRLAETEVGFAVRIQEEE